MKNPKLNLDPKSLLPIAKKYLGVVLKHAAFIAIVAVLLIYMFVVWKINSYANAEPSDDAQSTTLAKASVPHIDKNAIQQIQSLENTNTQVKSLFDQARDNPFQE